MNAKTVLLNAVVGMITGAAVLFFLREPAACCCGAPAVIILASLVGPAVSPLFYGYVLKPGSALGIGTIHGLLVGIAIVLISGIGMFALTSDDTVRARIDEWDRGFGEMLKEIDRQAEEGELSERDREGLKELEKKREDLRRLKEEPGRARLTMLTGIAMAALVLGVLGGLLGGWLGSLIFRDRLRKRPEDTPEDLMKMPEQPKPWWEEE